MSSHALLSPSAAHRWLNCTPAARLEATLPEKTSTFAQEGTVAHSVCEAAAKKYFKKAKSGEYTRTIKKLKNNPLWNDEMLHTAEIYVEHLANRAMQFEHEPYVAFEVGVDVSDYVPEAFGQCDCIMLGGDTLVITDYKHGKGVPVSAEHNPQLMLYALGAIKLYRPLFGDTIRQVEICIDQPRLNSCEGWTCKADELLVWGESIKPIAQKAFMGAGEYKAGDWCRFCRANGICKAQAEQQTSAFNDFKDVAIGELPNPALLTPEIIGDVLNHGGGLVNWYNTVKERALELILSGRPVPGYKAVEGKSNRCWSDQDKAFDTLMKAGIDRAILYDSVPKSLAQLEKELGKPRFNELVGSLIIRPQGKPALANANDTRKEYNSAAMDFAGAAEAPANGS